VTLTRLSNGYVSSSFLDQDIFMYFRWLQHNIQLHRSSNICMYV